MEEIASVDRGPGKVFTDGLQQGLIPKTGHGMGRGILSEDDGRAQDAYRKQENSQIPVKAHGVPGGCTYRDEDQRIRPGSRPVRL